MEVWVCLCMSALVQEAIPEEGQYMRPGPGCDAAWRDVTWQLVGCVWCFRGAFLASRLSLVRNTEDRPAARQAWTDTLMW